ncbi:MAG: hypothetical protein GKR96_06315 [Gammaproteobacteria bacterium]|nr:hypothetical protein [Gammaproteobacteria bacterium]
MTQPKSKLQTSDYTTIGMPANDGGKNGWYMILEPGEIGVTASWHALEFDNTAAADSMKTAGLPVEYQHSLVSGLWPSLSILPDVEAQNKGQALRLEKLQIRASR